ncbi:unnamed protein product [Penicillium salamii]|nr:unnamed protein product [Penicillium salamii]
MTFVDIPEHYSVVPVYIVSSTPGPHVGIACHITKLLHDPWTREPELQFHLLCTLTLPSHSPIPKMAPVTSALVLSLLTSLGGAIGYARTGSVPSIAAGLSVGLVYLLSFIRLRSGQSYGEELGLLASAVLGGSSIPRVIKTGGKPVPLGLSVLAVYGLWVFGLAYKERR